MPDLLPSAHGCTPRTVLACLQVNPIAVNSSFADVFTRNKRSVLWLSSPDYGEVAYVAIGATVRVPACGCSRLCGMACEMVCRVLCSRFPCGMPPCTVHL